MYPDFISYILFIGEFLLRELFLRRGTTAKKIAGSIYDKNSTLMAGGFIVIGFFTPLILNYLYTGFKFNSAIMWFGVLLMLIGITIHIIAITTLGKFYSRTLIIQEEHSLVQKGIYGKIRHPGYLGGILTWEGFALGTGNVLASLVITFLTILYFSYRITLEEKMLAKKFGSDYKEYTKRTWKLLPYFY